MNTKYQSGFTLVELLIYMGIFAVAATTITGILVTTVRVQNQEIASTEVAQQLNFVLNTVQRLVSQSSVIEKTYEGTNPANACTTFCTLKLRMTGQSGALDPTLISSTASGVYIQQGAGEQTSLTNSQITINNLKFTIYSATGGHATVQVNASFSYNSVNPQLAITKTLQSAVGRVSAATFDSDLVPSGSVSVGQSGSPWTNLYVNNLVGFGNIASDPTALSAGSVYYNTTSKNLKIWNGTNWQSILTPNSSGNVGIGTTSPGVKLQVVGRIMAQDATPGYWWSTDGTENRWHVQANTAGDLDFVESGVATGRLYLKKGGNVGIGTTSPDTVLNVAGTTRVEANSVPTLQLKRTGNTVANGNIEWLGSDDSVDWAIEGQNVNGLFEISYEGTTYFSLNRLSAGAAVFAGTLSSGAITSTAAGTLARLASDETITGAWVFNNAAGLGIKSKIINALADNGIAELYATDKSGLIHITITNSGLPVLFLCEAGYHYLWIVSDPGSKFSTTKGTAGKVNVYWDTDSWDLENKSGAVLTFHSMRIKSN